jgi:nanoRNase/pAp phosphatase (c-di-AMP/oligoRNAs hydrolase)
MSPTTSRKTSKRQRSARLLSVVRPFARTVVIMHDNPDPDAIATGWAIKLLLEKRASMSVRLLGGGDIVRAENRHMVRLLEPPLELVDQFEVPDGTAVVLVDCGPEATNHLVSCEGVRPTAVIDHHVPELLMELPYSDIRPGVAASATIAALYLREQELEPGAALATALVYAIHSETRGSAAPYTHMDRAVLSWLSRRADPGLLAEIENAPLTRAYFGDMVLALQSTFIYDDAAICLLPRAEGAEIIGEVADLLVRCEGIHRVLCCAVCDHVLLLSARTTKQGGNATQLLRETLRDIGRGGGHAHRAGGKLMANISGKKVPEELQDELRSRWLTVCGIPKQRGTRLVSKRDIVVNL